MDLISIGLFAYGMGSLFLSDRLTENYYTIAKFVAWIGVGVIILGVIRLGALDMPL
ncbi:unnamed protein product [marine sediment metagenome]|uniref:Uncharacterized protein n=1 Tax=marine sediment metagenome TaxID=412755 RepID=X1NTJ4_9ZZZZ